MSNKCKKISKAQTRHFFFLAGREDLYFRESITVTFKPYNRTYQHPHPARNAQPPPSLPPSTTIAATSPQPLSSPVTPWNTRVPYAQTTFAEWQKLNSKSKKS